MDCCSLRICFAAENSIQQEYGSLLCPEEKKHRRPVMTFSYFQCHRHTSPSQYKQRYHSSHPRNYCLRCYTAASAAVKREEHYSSSWPFWASCLISSIHSRTATCDPSTHVFFRVSVSSALRVSMSGCCHSNMWVRYMSPDSAPLGPVEIIKAER